MPVRQRPAFSQKPIWEQGTRSRDHQSDRRGLISHAVLHEEFCVENSEVLYSLVRTLWGYDGTIEPITIPIIELNRVCRFESCRWLATRRYVGLPWDSSKREFKICSCIVWVQRALSLLQLSLKGLIRVGAVRPSHRRLSSWYWLVLGKQTRKSRSLV